MVDEDAEDAGIDDLDFHVHVHFQFHVHVHVHVQDLILALYMDRPSKDY